MYLFEIVVLILLVPCGFLLLYLAILSVIALLFPHGPSGPALKTRRFAVIVPAHNEETTIGRTLRTLRALEYPADSVDVIAVADNCTDRTAETARALGVTVLERTDQEHRGKGRALRWCFDRLLQASPPYDAFAVIDADTKVDPGFLNAMNARLEQGAEAVQCADLVEPQPGVWSSEITRMGFMLYNFVRPLARESLGLSVGLRGNGMCFDAKVLRRFPWEAFALVEDLEYGLDLLLHGVRIVFAPGAIVHATMPREVRHAVSQRSRWEGGRFGTIRKYAPMLAGAALRRRSFAYVDALIDLVTPALVNLMGFTLLVVLASALLYAIGTPHGNLLFVVSLVVAGCGFLHLLAGLLAAKADKSLYMAILWIPRYAIWKILVYLGFFRRGVGSEWIRTTRD